MYRLRLFGEPLLEDPSGRPIPLGRIALALLALLARAPGHTLPRDRAAAMLWPDADDGAARRALRQQLFRLRAELPELVTGDRTRLRLDTARVDIDVVAFDNAVTQGAAREAATLYRDRFLGAFLLPACGEFEQWADGERARLQRSAAGALEEIVDDEAAHGRWRSALEHAQRWLDLEPYGDRAIARVIAATAQLGDTAAALARYDAFRTRLEAELGAAPPATLRQLVERIRRGGLATAATHTSAPAATAMPAELPFVGRAPEHAQLSAAWRRAQHGGRELVLLRGEAGIGKTRLAGEFAGWAAAQGATVLAARAFEVESGVPYAALAGALRAALRAPGLGGVEERTLAELSRIVPEYGTRFAAPIAQADSAFEAGKLRMLEAFRDLLDSLTHEAPVLLVIDDLPYADDATIATLHYAWRNLAAAPFLLVATARGAEPADLRGAERFIAGVLRESPDACTTLNLGPLSSEAVGRMLDELRTAHANGAALGADLLERRSGGNPLFIGELLRAAAEGVTGAAATETIRLIARERVAGLDAEPLALLHAAAVLGRQFALPVAGAMAELETGRTARAIDALLARGLIRQVAYGYDFVHDVVRESVLAELGPATRRLLHARAFSELSPADAATEDVGAERAGALALHAAAAGMRAEAHGWYLRAADAAIALYASAEASRALALALSHADSADERLAVWSAIAELARVRSDFRGAAFAYHQAYADASDADERLHLRLRMLHMGVRAGLFSLQDAQALAAELHAAAERAGDERFAELRFICADAAWRHGDLDAAILHAAAATDMYRRSGAPRPLARALLLHAAISARRGDPHALALLGEAERVARAHELQPETFDVRVEHATELSRLGRWDEAVAAFAALIADTKRAGDWGSCVVACVNIADLHVKRGEWEDARSAIHQVARICDRFDFPHVEVAAGLNAALMAWLQGNDEEAAARAAGVRASAEAVGLRAPAAAAAALEALVHIARGRIDEAAALITRDDGMPPARHATWSDDSELVTLARARILTRRSSTDAALTLLAGARAAARDPYAGALLALEQARLLAPSASAEADEAAQHARETARRLGAAPLARMVRQQAGTD